MKRVHARHLLFSAALALPLGCSTALTEKRTATEATPLNSRSADEGDGSRYDDVGDVDDVDGRSNRDDAAPDEVAPSTATCLTSRGEQPFGDTEADHQVSPADETEALLGVEEALAAIDRLHVLMSLERVAACDESASVYYMDDAQCEACVDVPVAEQAERARALGAVAAELGADIDAGATFMYEEDHVDGEASPLLLSLDDLPAQVTADLAALEALRVVRRPAFNLDECADCYAFVPDANNRRRVAVLHALVERVQAQASACAAGDEVNGLDDGHDGSEPEEG